MSVIVSILTINTLHLRWYHKKKNLKENASFCHNGIEFQGIIYSYMYVDMYLCALFIL